MSETVALGAGDPDERAAQLVAVVWVDRSVRAWNATLAALAHNSRIRQIHLGLHPEFSPEAITFKHEKLRIHNDIALVDLARKAADEAGDALLFCTWPAKPSPDAFDLAERAIARDPRIGTVSFLSNAAGAFSFPHRNSGTPFGVDGHDEVSLTRLLRDRRRDGETLTPVQLPDGGMIVVSRSVLDVCGDLECYGSQNLALALADLAMRGSKRGFNNFLDTATYITMPWDEIGPFQSVLLNPDARHALHQRYEYFPMNYDIEYSRNNSVLAEALDSARARATGLRILIDGSALGPKEMGTQVLTLKLSLALAERDDVQFVAVAVPDPANVPVYAQELTHHRKIQIVPAGGLDFPGAPQVDIIHRPYQPSTPIPWDRWRSIGKRTLITVQDLIAYRNVAYFQNCQDWIGYRDNFVRQMAQVDGVISISHDVVSVIKEERLPVDSGRVHVVENGADTRSKSDPVRIPDAILERGWTASPFLFVLGATYAHKNRDLAMRVWGKLRSLGYPHKLVLAGATVPFGSSRIEESLCNPGSDLKDILILPEVSSEERNWLLMNSGLVTYLTAAEGFGLVPFEAACVDVPTLFVSFGPLRELTADQGLPTSYCLDALVQRARDLLDDPVIARASVSGVLKNIDSLTWKETARKAVEAYFAALSQPSRVAH